MQGFGGSGKCSEHRMAGSLTRPTTVQSAGASP
jgi:hypothetical protein